MQLIASETVKDPATLCWFEMRLLVLHVQYRRQVEKLEDTIDKIQFLQIEEKDKRAATQAIVREIKKADRKFYGKV